MLKNVLASASSLFFPSFCLQCEAPEEKLLCTSCASQLELLDPTLRCKRCFSQTRPCTICKERPFSLSGIASSFSYYGPIKRILHAFKYEDQPYLAKSLASFLFLQWTRLSWPQPDVITFVPQHFLRTKMRGYNQSELLAKELGALLETAVLPLLQKKEATFSQALLSKELRSKMEPQLICYRDKECIEGKTVLLIDDVFTTGTTVQLCCNALQEGYPKAIYALTLCYTDDDNSPYA